MTDIIDQAQRYQERMLNSQLAAQVGKSRHIGPSLTHCEECDAAIPEPRRQALPGVTHCIECASWQERSAKR
jgi:phage/conjugal plasmid C-4 type zinc finger TraR family protein